MRTAAGDPDLRAAGHTLPQVGRLPLLWWALGVAGGGRGGLLGGSDSDFTEGVRVGRHARRLRLRLSGTLPGHPAKAESQRASGVHRRRRTARASGIRVAVGCPRTARGGRLDHGSDCLTSRATTPSQCQPTAGAAARQVPAASGRRLRGLRLIWRDARRPRAGPREELLQPNFGRDHLWYETKRSGSLAVGTCGVR